MHKKTKNRLNLFYVCILVSFMLLIGFEWRCQPKQNKYQPDSSRIKGYIQVIQQIKNDNVFVD